jgi:Arc/MetJ family transcription regulator
MRTNIEIEDHLLSEAIAASHATTKKAAVETALRLAVQLSKQRGIVDLFGNVQWDGDLDAMRQGRMLEWQCEPSGEECESKSDDTLSSEGSSVPSAPTRSKASS